MHVKLLPSSLAALAMLVFAAASEPAQARDHSSHGYGGSSGWSPHFTSVRQFSGSRHFIVRHFRHHRRFALVDVYPYDYDDGCYWLRRRAVYSGSPYWWRRYYACRQAYY
jgi:hypothetical protein